MRHKGENLLISSGFKQRMKQNTLFSACALTAIAQESPVLILLNTSLEADSSRRYCWNVCWLGSSESTSGLFDPWGQYVRTDDKLKGGAGADGKSKEGR
jgi:hypothetical protein